MIGARAARRGASERGGARYAAAAAGDRGRPRRGRRSSTRSGSPSSTREHRGKDGPTDVLSFPVDEAEGRRRRRARARRRRHLPRAHRGPARGGRPRRAAPRPGWTTRPTTARCSRCRPRSWRGCDDAASGFVALAGRPNVGKSTLVNAMVGRKVAIVSDKPQTTRRAIRGVVTTAEPRFQLVLTDLPGVQRPRDALTRRMQRRVEHGAGRGRRGAVRRQRRPGRRRPGRPLHRRGAGEAPACRS